MLSLAPFCRLTLTIHGSRAAIFISMNNLACFISVWAWLPCLEAPRMVNEAGRGTRNAACSDLTVPSGSGINEGLILAADRPGISC